MLLLTVILISVGVVGFMALSLSLTRLAKGHDIRGEVGTNPDMQRLGLECPAHGHNDKKCASSCDECVVKEFAACARD